MGWICHNCGSENPNEEKACLACLKKAGALYRLVQRMRKPRTDMAENAMLEKLVEGGGKLLKRLSRTSRILMLILFLACVGVLALNAVSIEGEDTLRIGLNDTWRARWTDLWAKLEPGEFRKTLLVAMAEKRYTGLRDGVASRMDKGRLRLEATGKSVQEFFNNGNSAAKRMWSNLGTKTADRLGQAPQRANQSVQNALRALRGMLDRLQTALPLSR